MINNNKRLSEHFSETKVISKIAKKAVATLLEGRTENKEGAIRDINYAINIAQRKISEAKEMPEQAQQKLKEAKAIAQSINPDVAKSRSKLRKSRKDAKEFFMNKSANSLIDINESDEYLKKLNKLDSDYDSESTDSTSRS